MAVLVVTLVKQKQNFAYIFITVVISVICLLVKKIYNFKGDSENANFLTQFCQVSISNEFFKSEEISLKGSISGLRTFLATESPSKIWKMFFISPQKLFLLVRYINFCFDFLVIEQNTLIRKMRLIPSFMVISWLKNNCNTHIPQNLEK